MEPLLFQRKAKNPIPPKATWNNRQNSEKISWPNPRIKIKQREKNAKKKRGKQEKQGKRHEKNKANAA